MSLNQIGKRALLVAEEIADEDESRRLTLDDVISVMPKGMKRYFTPDNLQKINDVLDGHQHPSILRENILAYSHVLEGNGIGMNNYLNAIQYVTYKMAGLTSTDAWIKTFPDSYRHLVVEGKTDQLSPRVSAYNNSKTVSMILEQAMIPIWLMNQDAYQEAIATQVEIMRSAKSEKVRSDAANSLMNHLKAPETAKMQLDITVNQKNFIGELREVVQELAITQEHGIKSGNARVIDIAEYEIVKSKE